MDDVKDDPKIAALQGDPDDPTLPGVPKRKRAVHPLRPETPTPARNPTKYELQLRRIDVERLRLRGLSVDQIAKALTGMHRGVSVKSVKADLEIVQRENVEKLRGFDREKFLSDVMAQYEEIRRQAWSEVQRTQPGTNARARALELAMSAEDRILRSALDTGLAPRDERPGEESDDVPLTPELVAAITDFMIQRQLSSPLGTPRAQLGDGKVIDAEEVGDDDDEGGEG